MRYILIKAICPLCGVVKHFVSVNEIHRMVCDDCQDRCPDTTPEMILSVEEETT